MDYDGLYFFLCDQIICQLCEFLCKLVWELGFMCSILVGSDLVFLVVYVFIEIGFKFGLQVCELGELLYLDKFNISC